MKDLVILVIATMMVIVIGHSLINASNDMVNEHLRIEGDK